MPDCFVFFSVGTEFEEELDTGGGRAVEHRLLRELMKSPFSGDIQNLPGCIPVFLENKLSFVVLQK